MKQKYNAKLMMISSMIIFGTIGLFVKNIALSSGEIALSRAVIATIIIGAFLIIKKHKISFVKIRKVLPFLLISGFALGFNWIFLFEAYKYTTVSVATLSYYFAPVLVTALCPIIFKEKLSLKKAICFVMSTIGIVLVTGLGDFSSADNNALGIIFGLGAAMFYATVIIMNKFIKSVNGLERTLLQFISSIIVLIPYIIFTGGFHIFSIDSISIINLIIIGVLHTGFTYCLYFTSIKDLSGQETAILGYIDPLIAVVLSVTILHEELKLMQIIGGILILGFTLLSEISLKSKTDSE